MTNLQKKLLTDTWLTATWDEYIQVITNPFYHKAKSYYYNGKMRFEMPPIGNDHSRDHTVVIIAVSIYAAIKGIAINGNDNCTYRKKGFKEAQPDVSYYIGENAGAIPWGTGIINLDDYPAPNLVIEVANSSLADDKGEKRLLYEELGVDEYWIIDVQKVQVIAFAVENGGSRRITQSQILPGLAISLLEEAFRRTRQTHQSQVVAWLLSEFSQ
ncbi:Uma2 family endonuclease [Nostoc sp. TCL26-01]|uniref:Uma2 family endonuclease n=1 Tax=Nostoc sp. TCL26-01 TaxID=2576904 RepID=UPI0015BC3DE4|nr:Uma2 family endonuclease [Nostoc sp. TCL26-01]QLE56128.1 Uma2 family endonuclease [Nostoc sp. TCL26-01]